MKALYWFRHDLRLRDNPGFAAVLRDAAEVTPVATAPDATIDAHDDSGPRARLWSAALGGLHRELTARGSALILRQGDPLTELLAIAERRRVDALYFTRFDDPELLDEEIRVLDFFTAAGFLVRTIPAAQARDHERITDHEGRPLRTFRGFLAVWSNLKAAPPPRLPDMLPPLTEAALLHGSLQAGRPRLTPEMLTVGGEAAAHRRWLDFLHNRLFLRLDPVVDIDRPHGGGCSPDLATGALSPGLLLRSLAAQQEHHLTGHMKRCINEVAEGIALREYCQYRLATDVALREELRAVRALKRPEAALADDPRQRVWLNAWMRGRTGVPIVDAGMRCLDETGLPPHEVRVICALFLLKELRLPWQAGFLHYASRLIDHDAAVNLVNWRALAGCETGMPAFRMARKHPVRAGMIVDPQGRFIARFTPELADLPSEFIHAPWQRHLLVGRRWGVRLGKTYPLPLALVRLAPRGSSRRRG